MAARRITRRWLFNSFGVIIVILVALIGAFSIGIRGYYYNLVWQAGNSRLSTLSTYIGSLSKRLSPMEYQTELRNLVANFEDKDKMELMALNGKGQIAITSSGFESEETVEFPDFAQALLDESGTARFQGDLNGENVCAITQTLTQPSDEITALRVVISMSRVDRQIISSILVISLVGLLVIGAVLFSSLYFINSIIAPLDEVGETAKEIAQGNFSAKLEKKNDDEIGDLVEVINHMAEELASTEQMKNDFISSVSHELRTPLTAIKGWGETLSDPAGMDPQMLQKGMRVIVNETQRLSSMVEELLDFSRIQSGRLSLSMARIDLVAELSEAVLMFTERAKRENIRLFYDEPELFFPVTGDKNRLRQVFVNIIDNALKYSDSGDTVTVSIQKQGNFAVIGIADTGIGIRPEDLPKVKEKFYKANSTRRGSGIGLAVADEIITCHGGTLSLDSTLGKGTTVTIQIPLCPKNAVAEE